MLTFACAAYARATALLLLLTVLPLLLLCIVYRIAQQRAGLPQWQAHSSSRRALQRHTWALYWHQERRVVQPSNRLLDRQQRSV
jgi:hypothetical protein